MEPAGFSALLEALAAAPPAVWLARSGTAYLVVNALHIAALGLGVGAAVLLDLRLLQVVGRQLPLALLGPFLSRAAAAGLGLAVLTGLWLFSVRGTEYVDNPAFLIKLALIGVALANAGVMHASGCWAARLRAGHADGLARAQALLSLGLWLGALLAGRWIGFL